MSKTMIKVKFLKPHPRFGYFGGDLAEVTSDAAAELLKGGNVIILPDDGEEEDEDEGDEDSLPSFLPARKKLAALGCKTLEQVKALFESGKLKDEGLNASELGKLKKYLDNLAKEEEDLKAKAMAADKNNAKAE